jgi:two-component system phosphate regulon sensor histidine kinase PhoR
VGLSADELSHLFDRFYRTESARQSAVPGSGLGMGITRDIVRQHGGELGVSSEPGVGTTFLMSLPTARPTGAAPRSTMSAHTTVD